MQRLKMLAENTELNREQIVGLFNTLAETLNTHADLAEAMAFHDKARQITVEMVYKVVEEHLSKHKVFGAQMDELVKMIKGRRGLFGMFRRATK